MSARTRRQGSIGGPFWARYDEHGHVAAIEHDGHTILILATGAVRNTENVEAVVDALNLVWAQRQ